MSLAYARRRRSRSSAVAVAIGGYLALAAVAPLLAAASIYNAYICGIIV